MPDGFFDPRNTSRALPMALLRARESVMARFRPMLQSHGITEQQWRVIRMLAEHPECDISQVADQTFILGPSLSRILRTLETQKLVRKRRDKADGRRYWLSLTEKGNRLLEEVRPDSVRIYEGIQQEFGDANLEALLGLLNEAIQRLEKR